MGQEGGPVDAKGIRFSPVQTHSLGPGTSVLDLNPSVSRTSRVFFSFSWKTLMYQI